MALQFGFLARLTWWEYSWDIMEPVTYFVTYAGSMLFYAYFVLTREVSALSVLIFTYLILGIASCLCLEPNLRLVLTDKMLFYLRINDLFLSAFLGQTNNSLHSG